MTHLYITPKDKENAFIETTRSGSSHPSQADRSTLTPHGYGFGHSQLIVYEV